MSKPGRILAVDDTPASLKLLTELLQDEGYSVRSAPSGEMALHSALKNPPELIVLDVRMPGMDGFEVCRRLKAEPHTAAIPIIFVSGLSEIEDKVEGFKLGAVDFMTKPFQREELLVRVQTHLESSRLHNQLEILVEERTEQLRQSLDHANQQTRLLQDNQRRLEGSEHRWKFALEGAGDGVWDWNPQTDEAFFSKRWKGMLGYSEDEFFNTGEAWADHLHPDDKQRVFDVLNNYLLRAQGDYSVEFRMRCKDDSWKWILGRGKIVAFDDAGKPIRMIGTHTDITNQKNNEERIQKLAFYDSLTGLANRSLFYDRLKQALLAAERSEKNGALLYIDLDDFKTLNDSLGHDVGDALLVEVAKSLLECIRANDTVARIGGDEFVILLEDLSSQQSEAADQSKNVAMKILDCLNQSFTIDAYVCRTTPSIGVTLFSRLSAEEHLKQADIAMYQAKKAGRNTVRFFDPEMQDKVNAHAQMEGELRNAILNREFLLFYQVQVDEDGHAVGAEALVRWNHPVRGYIFPGEFIPLAEETGLIVQIGDQVLDMACAQISLWQERGVSNRIPLSVNVSLKQFQRSNFVDVVRAKLEKHQVDPALLKLELTESVLLEHMDEALSTMKQLKALGVHFALDDFGTGYSSLQYLKQLPLDQLKIDQSFVMDLVSDKNDQAIVFTIIVMAQSLGLDVIAEGVEMEEQRNTLLQHGCKHFQGYLFGKPMPLKEFEASILKQAG